MNALYNELWTLVLMENTVNVTVHARDNITKQEWTSIFYPRVDEFSLLELSGNILNSFYNIFFSFKIII